mgnify:CR=1 FL=1
MGNATDATSEAESVMAKTDGTSDGTKGRGWALRQANEEANRITCDCLRTAVLQLAGSESFDKLTVTAVTRRAGVSRTAFYRNYGGMEELVADACGKLRADLLESLSSERYRNDRRQWYESFFATIRDNAGYFQIYLDANVPLAGEDVLEAAYPSDTPEGLCRNRAREGAFLAVLTGWFRDGMRETPSQMADICERILG